MNSYPEPSYSPWGSLALVTYLPEPLGSYLTELRRCIEQDHNPAAHITFLPPRPLSLPVEQAEAEVERRLASIKPFEVELGDLAVFSRTNVLYLNVTTGRENLLNLHALMNTGPLQNTETFEFTPHLTVSNPLPPSDIAPSFEKARSSWDTARLPSRFLVQDVVLLWQPGSCTEKDWIRRKSFHL